MPDTSNVFISYARKDGSDEAARLYDDLTARDIGAWRDTRDLDPYTDFGGEIERAIVDATHVAVCVTPDIRRADSFVRREIAFALEENKPIIPLMFPGGRCPITIINHTRIDFADWDTGLRALLDRLGRGVEEITPETRRQRELAYLQTVGQRYDHWRDLYTDMAATARIEQAKVHVKPGAAARYLEMQHDIFRDIEHTLDDDRAKTVSVEGLDELREGIRDYQRVALIGDPGAGKTTTLERLAYELATEAAEHDDQPLPLFVRLGAYDGGDFDAFLDAAFGGLRLREYLPGRAFVLLDGLNEMQPEHAPVVDEWLRAHPDAPVIVTCRKLDYVGHKLPLQRVDVAPLDVRRIRLFIGSYLEDADRDRLFWALSGVKTRAAWEWFRREAKDATFDDFWFGKTEEAYSFEVEKFHLKQVQDNLHEQGKLPGMLGVVRNPFLLFITVQIYTRSGQPPANRGQLFDQFVTLLMKQRGEPAARTRPPWIQEHTQRQALAALAYRMQAENTPTSVEAEWACRVIQEALPGEDAEQLLYLAASASIIEHGANVRFVHQLLQEYFAAYEMREDLRRGVPATKYWPGDRWWEQTGWEETALLLAGMEGDATDIVRWLTPVQPTLAYRCATESGAQCADDALHALYEPGIPPIPKYENGDEVDRWRAELPRISPLARAEWGRILDEQGDNRKGVGLKPSPLAPLPEGEGKRGRGLRGEGLVPDIDWVEIPAGEFIYQKGEKLTLPAFYISRYAITYRQFQAFIDAPHGFHNPEWWEGLAAGDDHKSSPGEQGFKYWNHPRERVSWWDAVAFCRWLSSKLGFEVTLPTEQQFEKAARGTDGRTYPWGDAYIPGYANVDETWQEEGPYYIRQTTAVGMYPQGASPYGVLDLSGNVWCWCLNTPDGDIGLGGERARVLRGGSCSLFRYDARSVVRNLRLPYFRYFNRGFWCVCASPMT